MTFYYWLPLPVRKNLIVLLYVLIFLWLIGAWVSDSPSQAIIYLWAATLAAASGIALHLHLHEPSPEATKPRHRGLTVALTIIILIALTGAIKHTVFPNTDPADALHLQPLATFVASGLYFFTQNRGHTSYNIPSHPLTFISLIQYDTCDSR